jgi:CBS domain-containing protein
MTSAAATEQTTRQEQGGTVAQLRDIMTTKVLTTSAERPVAEVTAMMVKARVGSAIVLQGSWLAGILTERDVLRAAASRSDHLTRVAVDDQGPGNGHSRHDNRGGRPADADERVPPPPRLGGPEPHGDGQHPRRLGLRDPPTPNTGVDLQPGTEASRCR